MSIIPKFKANKFDKDSILIDNDYFPLAPGSIRVTSGTEEDDGETTYERIDHFTTSATKEIGGITTLVVRDTVYANGAIAEDTLDWYAQDKNGNVWYMGEDTYSFEYEDGAFEGVDHGGSFEHGVDGALAGIIMTADPVFGAGYYSEYAVDQEAVDEWIVVGKDEDISLDAGDFSEVLRTLETTAVEPDVAEYKLYAPGVGLIAEEALDEDGEVEVLFDLVEMRDVGAFEGGFNIEPDDEDDDDDADDETDVMLSDLSDGIAIEDAIAAANEAEAVDFISEGATTWHITVLGGVADLDNALGAYAFDGTDGTMGEGRILFSSTASTESAATATVDVAAGDGLGLFLVQYADSVGLDFDDYADGGLHFTNFGTGEVATLGDVMAPLVRDDDDTPLPIASFQSVDGTYGDGYNFVNPVAGLNVLDITSETLETLEEDQGIEVELLAFEERVATDEDADFDFNDLIVAVSKEELDSDTIEALLAEMETSIINNGTDGNDKIKGGALDDMLCGGDGKDKLKGKDGDDVLKGNAGKDKLWGHDGDDILKGGKNKDWLTGGEGDDILNGGGGVDTAVFEGLQEDFMIDTSGDDIFVTDLAGDLGMDTLIDIEQIMFDDGLMVL